MEKTQHLKVPNSVFQSWNFIGDIMTFGGRKHPCLRDCLAFLDTWGKKWTKRGIQSSFWNTDHFSIRSVLFCNTEDVVPLLLNWNPAKIVHVIINPFFLVLQESLEGIPGLRCIRKHLLLWKIITKVLPILIFAVTLELDLKQKSLEKKNVYEIEPTRSIFDTDLVPTTKNVVVTSDHGNPNYPWSNWSQSK